MRFRMRSRKMLRGDLRGADLLRRLGATAC